MKKGLNILVTGCGGDIGQSVGKILSKSKYAKNVFGIDISDKNAAQFVFDNFAIGPKVSDENYIGDIEKYVIKNKIDIIVPVSEHELRFFTDNYKGVPVIGCAQVLMANHFSRTIGFNKTSTTLFLKENNLPNPVLYTSSSKEIIFPIIAKPNTGAGSSNVFIVDDYEELLFLATKNQDFIFQELLDGKEGEFTCCAYRTKKGDIRNITFKRELTSGGYSGYGEVIEDKRIDALLIQIAKLLDLEGSINIQLRIHKEMPVVFEINPRFSSTILFRDLLGFKDLEWSIQEFLGEEIFDYKKPQVGKCFYKGYIEYIV
jgi:carbamoyl-phosphate synthase large subunit